MNPYTVNQTLNLDIRNVPDQDCLYMFGKKALPQDCNEDYPCGICKLPENQLIYMKGTAYVNIRTVSCLLWQTGLNSLNNTVGI